MLLCSVTVVTNYVTLALVSRCPADVCLVSAADENEKQEPEIIYGPRKRKVVRFNTDDDDADLDDLPPAGPRAGRGRGRGRRGRPPRNPTGGAYGTATAAAAAAAGGGSGAYGAMGYVADMYAGQNLGLSGRPVAYPGNLVPGNDGQGLAQQQQQMYGVWGQVGLEQQQQMWPGGR